MSYMNEMFSTGFGEAIVRFFVCFFVNWIIVHFLYYKKSHRRDFYFTFIIMSDWDSSVSSASCVTVQTRCLSVR